MKKTDTGCAQVSVVVPAYNAEWSLEQAVRSLFKQTLQNIEIWIVDDGSTDGTGGLVDRLCSVDSRVRVIHQSNRGTYMARLNALRRIKTPYFGFLDADDRVEPQMYKSMLEWAEAEHLDVVQCRQDGDVRADGNRTILGDRKAVEQNVVRPFLLEEQGALFVWDKLYRNIYDFSGFVNAPITMFEDMVFNLQFFREIERIGFLNEGLYHYQVNDGSSVRNYRAKNLYDFLYTVRFRMKVCDVYGWRDVQTEMNRWVVRNARNLAVVLATAPVNTFATRLKNLRAVLEVQEIRGACKVLWKLKKMDLAWLYLVLASYCPLLFLLVVRWAKGLSLNIRWRKM